MAAFKHALESAATALTGATTTAPKPADSLAHPRHPASTAIGSHDDEVTVYAVALEDNGDPKHGKTVRTALPRPLAILQPDPASGPASARCSPSLTLAFERTQLLRLPPPSNPYVLRITIDAGTKASRNGVLHTNFPLDGGKFEREKYAKVT